MKARIVHSAKFYPVFETPEEGFSIEVLRFGFLWVPFYINGIKSFYKTKESAEKTVAILERNGTLA